MTLLDRPLPANLDAERLVLGVLLRNDEAMTDVRGLLVPDDFSTDAHRTIWGAMCEIYDSGGNLDRVTVCTKLQDTGRLEKAAGFGYVIGLDELCPSTPHIGDYVQTIRDKAQLRRVIRAASGLAERAYASEPVRDVLDAAARIAIDLTPQTKSRGFVSVRDVVEEKGVDAVLSNRRTQGIKLPWPRLNAMLCGLQPEQVVLLAAHTSCGKTSLALQIAWHAAMHNVGVAIFSLEMSTVSLIRRMVNQAGRIDDNQARHGLLGDEDSRRQLRTLNELASTRLFFDDNATATVPGMHAALRKLRMQHDIGLVMVDFLQCIRGRAESRNQEVGANSRALKLAAKEFGIPFLVLSQLSRKSTHEDREPTLADLRDSGEIEENADTVLFIHPMREGQSDEIKPAKVMVAKQREGPRDVWTRMMFRPACQRFDEVED